MSKNTTTRERRELLWIPVVVIIALGMHTLVQTELFSLTPAPLLIALALTWTLRQPLSALIVLAIFAELLAMTSFGSMTLAVLIPYGVHRLRGRITPDISFSFALLLMLSAFLQLGALQAAEVLSFQRSALTPAALDTILPWKATILSTIALTISSLALVAWYHRQAPTEYSSMVSLEGSSFRRKGKKGLI